MALDDVQVAVTWSVDSSSIKDQGDKWKRGALERNLLNFFDPQMSVPSTCANRKEGREEEGSAPLKSALIGLLVFRLVIICTWPSKVHVEGE